ncbi:MAG TPA: hypothetical protein VLQ20_02190 [Planococcus sp. (in: firmicutes)]|nr:hypothetical protein [Planococcus sp. (in: firmicutes)]
MKQSQKLTKELIDPYFEEWQRLNTELLAAHHQRNANAAGLMVQGIRLFNALLEECGGELLPLNYQDRMGFIKTHPAQFAAFRQLDELFTEMKKTISSKRAQLNKAAN